MNKNMLISGASRGIGLEVARLALQQGFQVIGTATSDTGLVRMENEFGAFKEQFYGLKMNLLDYQSIVDCADSVASRWEYIDVLINNAGCGAAMKASVAAHSKEDWDRVIGTNITGMFYLTHSLLAQMRPNDNACIINVSGVLGRFATGMKGGKAVAYRVSKGSVNIFSLVLAEELREKSIRAFAFDPGWVRTDLGGPHAPRSAEEVAPELLSLTELPASLSGRCIQSGQACAW